jgi:alanyl-tRNA synthetase
MVDADRLRSMFLAFFAERGHVILPPRLLIPEGDPLVLFTTAGGGRSTRTAHRDQPPRRTPVRSRTSV